MKIEIKDVLFWMDAIRNSDDRYRTLESFWKGQVNSKLWLIDNLKHYHHPHPYNILLCGGWNGVLATLLFNTDLNISKITSMDIDPKCEKIACDINKAYEIEGKFKAITNNMLDYKEYDNYNLIINTACEHMTQDDFNKWIDLLPTTTRIILQSNDYFAHKEHINCKTNLDEFKNGCGIDVNFAAELPTDKYKRFMIMGIKT